MADTSAPTVELLVGSTWTDISSYVYYRDMITIKRGRSDEASRSEPSTCALTLNNRDGRFSPRNPTGTYYGQIGRNTQIRVSVNGGLPYGYFPGGTSDKFTTPDAAALDVVGDLDLRMEFDVAVAVSGAGYELAGKYNTTGNQRSWFTYLTGNGNLAFRWSADGTTFTEVQSTSVLSMPVYSRRAFRITMDVNNGAGGNTVTFYTSDSISGTWTQLGDPVVTAGTTSIFSSTAILELGSLSSVSANPLNGRIYAFQMLSGIGGTAVANPDFTAQTAGATSFTDAAGRTWTAGGSATITDKRVRFVGEVSNWPVQWDISGKDVYVQIEAAGITRRLGQGSNPLFSPLRRSMAGASNLLAYWPMEDGSNATQSSSPIAGVSPMSTLNFTYAANTTEPGSDPLPTVFSSDFLGGGGGFCTMSAPVPHSSASSWRVEFLYYLPSNVSSLSQMLEIWTTGSDTYQVHRIYLNPGNIRVISTLLDGSGVTSPFISVTSSNLAGRWNQVYFYMSTSAGTTSAKLALVDVATGTETSGTTSYSGTAGNITEISADFNSSSPTTDLRGMAVGHYAVFSSTTDSTMSVAMDGYSGETPSTRITRLSNEENFSSVVPYDTSYEHPMGPQTSNTILTLLQQAEDADQGVMFESRNTAAVQFRDIATLYNQSSRLTVDYSQHQLADSLNPVDDDRYTRNDVTVSRTNGSSSRQVLTSGTLSNQSPPNGVGPYTDNLTVNVQSDSQLSSVAYWKLHKGTVDQARYPSVHLNLRHSTFTSSATMMDNALRMDIGDRFTITNPPAWLPPGDIDILVQGYTEVLGIRERDLYLIGSPYTPYEIASTNGSGSTAARADTGGSTLTTGVNSTATSISVTTQAGSARWVDSATYASDFPFDIIMGGERMTVTAVTGTSSPQTFTVTRSVNGVSKSQTAGTAITLFYQTYVGL